MVFSGEKINGYIGFTEGEDITEDIPKSGLFYGLSGFKDFEGYPNLRLNFLISQDNQNEPVLSIGSLLYYWDYGSFEFGKLLLPYGLHSSQRIIPSVDFPKTLNETFLGKRVFDTYPNANIGILSNIKYKNNTLTFGLFQPRKTSLINNYRIRTFSGYSDADLETLVTETIDPTGDNLRLINRLLYPLYYFNLTGPNSVNNFRRTRNRIILIATDATDNSPSNPYGGKVVENSYYTEKNNIDNSDLFIGLSYDNLSNIKTNISLIKTLSSDRDRSIETYTGGLEYKFFTRYFYQSEFLVIKKTKGSLDQGMFGYFQGIFLDNYPWGYYLNYTNFSNKNGSTNLKEVNLGLTKSWGNLSTRLNYRILNGNILLSNAVPASDLADGCGTTCNILNQLFPGTEPYQGSPEVVQEIEDSRLEFRIRFNF